MDEQNDAPVDAADTGARLFLMASVAVKRERDYQDAKYGLPDHELGTWLLILEQELAEAKQAFFDGRTQDALMEILQVAAMGFAAMAEHGILERPELRGKAALSAIHMRQLFDEIER